MSAQVTGTWEKSLPTAKVQARENGGLLMVVACNSVTCPYCKAAEAGVFSKSEWQEYSRSKGMPQYLADAAVYAPRKVFTVLTRDYHIVFWPTVLLFKLRPDAKLTTTALKNGVDVDLVGSFVFRKGRYVNGTKIASVTPAALIQAVKSFKV